MKKYRITLTEQQLMLIANCVEDCHRFACGQTELHNTISYFTTDPDLRKTMMELKPLVTPELSHNQFYDWTGNGCKNRFQKKFIAMTYAIYREILYKVVNSGVYKSETLTCTEGGNPPVIETVGETSEQKDTLLKELWELANSDTSFLSRKEGYARGYSDATIRQKELMKEIFDKNSYNNA